MHGIVFGLWLLVAWSADSIDALLQRREGPLSVAGESARASAERGQIAYARGDFARAAERFSRAADKLGGADAARARFDAATCELALGRLGAARKAYLEVTRTSAGLRAAARLGIAFTWEAERRPERALDAVTAALGEPPGEHVPAALELRERLARALGRQGEAASARERLLADWPTSIEALRVRAAASP